MFEKVMTSSYSSEEFPLRGPDGGECVGGCGCVGVCVGGREGVWVWVRRLKYFRKLNQY